MKITKDTLIGDALQIDVELAQFFFEIGMHCLCLLYTSCFVGKIRVIKRQRFVRKRMRFSHKTHPNDTDTVFCHSDNHPFILYGMT